MSQEDYTFAQQLVQKEDEDHMNRMDWRAMAEKISEIFSRQYPESADSHNLDLRMDGDRLYCRLCLMKPERGNSLLFLQPPVTELDADDQHYFLDKLLPSFFELCDELETVTALREKGENRAANTILELLAHLIGEVTCFVTVNVDRQVQALIDADVHLAVHLPDCRVELDVKVGEHTFTCSGFSSWSGKDGENLLFKDLFDIPELLEVWDAGQ